MPSFFDLQKYAATGIASADMTYYDKMRASTLMGGSVKTLTGQPPLSFKADGTPLISWSMKGNGSQTGTPTPDNPVMPEFVGVRTVNVCPPAAAETKTNNGITAVSNGSGTYHVSGTATAVADIRFDVPSFLIPISITGGRSGTYSLFNSAAYNIDDVKIAFYYQGTKVDEWGLTGLNLNNTNYRAMGGKDCDAIGFTVKSGVTVDFTISPEFTNDGILPTEYEPYGWAEKITCAGQTVPVYLGQTQTVRRVGKVRLGDLTWAETTVSDVACFISTEQINRPYGAGGYTLICDRYKPVNTRISAGGENNTIAPFNNTNSNRLVVHDSRYETAAAWIAENADTYLWYILDEPTTGIVNEPLAKIGDYADELHSEDAGVSIPTVRGQNVLTVDTPIQPSEMSITYRG